MHVLAIARIWGTSLGLPHPGLMPNKREWQAQHDLVAEALKGLARHGIEASGQVLSSRNAGKRILAEARRRKADAIVMGADGPRHWLVNDMIWSQEPYRIRRLSPVPVYLLAQANTQRAARLSLSPAHTNSIPIDRSIRLTCRCLSSAPAKIGWNWRELVVVGGANRGL